MSSISQLESSPMASLGLTGGRGVDIVIDQRRGGALRVRASHAGLRWRSHLAGLLGGARRQSIDLTDLIWRPREQRASPCFAQSACGESRPHGPPSLRY